MRVIVFFFIGTHTCLNLSCFVTIVRGIFRTLFVVLVKLSALCGAVSSLSVSFGCFIVPLAVPNMLLWNKFRDALTI